MESTEDLKKRKEMVTMHDFFIEKIENAIERKSYIESCWLIYSCLENRYFRAISKFKIQCKYGKNSCKKNKNELALRTKIRCIERLCNEKISCISDYFDETIFSKTLNWVKKRNDLMHDLLELEKYEDHYNEDFKKMSEEGYDILKETYESCTKFRKSFFDKSYIFKFPECCMEKCSCKPKKENNENESTNK